MSALLATLIAMTSGFSMVVVAAVILYAGAAAVFHPARVGRGRLMGCRAKHIVRGAKVRAVRLTRSDV
jgi:hypothetical protein